MTAIKNDRTAEGTTTQLQILSKKELSRRSFLEDLVTDGLNTFQKVGLALCEIRDSRLYRDEYDTFEEYCRAKWDITRTHANRLIGASQVAKTLEPLGAEPASEAVIRPLTPLSPEDQKRVWKEVTKQVSDPREITSRLVIDTTKSMGLTPLRNVGRPAGSLNAPVKDVPGMVAPNGAKEQDTADLAPSARRRLAASIETWFRSYIEKNPKATAREVVPMIKRMILST